MTGRHYVVDGERLPSVTTILAQAMPNHGIAEWRARVGAAEADRISKEATDWGTEAHRLVEAVNRSRDDTLTDDERSVIEPYRAWYAENVVATIAAEQLLVSRRFRYAGTTDAILMLRGDTEPTLVDFKSSRTPLGIVEWRAQTAAYCLAGEESGYDCRRRIIIRMPRAEPGSIYIHDLPEDQLVNDQRAFLAALRLFNWHASIKPVKRPVGPRIRFGVKA